jgi:dnd system-associated protein 4
MGKAILRYLKTDLYDTLVDDYGIFQYSYDLLVFLAVLGYREGSPVRSDYAGDRSKGTLGEIGLDNLYSNELYRAAMASLAFQDTGDPEALVDTKRQMDILAQYAAGGLEVAEDEFGSNVGDPTDAMVSFLKGYKGGADDVEGELQTIIQAFEET